MPRRRERELASSLFPFLSVLACVIGTLTLLIAALAMNQVARGLQPPDPDAPPTPEIQTQRALVRALERDLGVAREDEAERAATRAQLASLGIASNTPDEALQQVSARLEAAALARRIADLEREARELDDALVGTTASLDDVRDSDEERVIRIYPEGRGTALRPFFVECRAEGLRLYHEGLQGSVFLDRMNRQDIVKFDVFLRRARSIPNHTVLFLIRPDGVATYSWALEKTSNYLVRHAKLPLPGQGELEFAL